MVAKKQFKLNSSIYNEDESSIQLSLSSRKPTQQNNKFIACSLLIWLAAGKSIPTVGRLIVQRSQRTV